MEMWTCIEGKQAKVELMFGSHYKKHVMPCEI